MIDLKLKHIQQLKIDKRLLVTTTPLKLNCTIVKLNMYSRVAYGVSNKREKKGEGL